MPLISFVTWDSIPGVAQAAFDGWGVTALGVICILQYVVYLHRTRANQNETTSAFHEIRTELDNIQRDHRITRLENRLLREFMSETDVDRAIRVLLNNLIPNTDRGFAATLEISGKEISVGQSRGLSREARKALAVDPAILERASSGEPFVLEGREFRTSRLAASLTTADRRHIHRLFIMGIQSADALTGLLIATHMFQDETADQRHIVLLKQLVQRISELRRSAVALESQQHELTRTNDILELRAITDARFESPVDMIQEFMAALKGKTAASRAVLYISTTAEDVSRNSFVRCGTVPNPNVERQLCQAEDAIAAQAHSTMTTQVFSRTDLLRHGIRSFLTYALAVPLVRKGATVGAICLSRESADKFHDADIELAQWAADYLAGTILNALQHAQVEQQARTDSLTGMANRACFDDAIKTEVCFAHDTDACCSLLLLDIDRFKVINDKFGHLVGDHVLRSTAQTVLATLEKTRVHDRVLAARYGGEEFAILMPGVNETGAARMAEMIRESISEHTFVFAGTTIPTTVSIGVATLPKHAVDAIELIAAADGALYFAKESGRNRVAIARSADSPAEDAPTTRPGPSMSH